MLAKSRSGKTTGWYGYGFLKRYMMNAMKVDSESRNNERWPSLVAAARFYSNAFNPVLPLFIVITYMFLIILSASKYQTLLP
jgi:hypothetical protein